MTAIVYYLLKVMLCSGILFLYYQLALRNKVFHQWNRFYLILAVVLSLLLPLMQFTLKAEEATGTDAWLLLQSLRRADNTLEEFVVISGSRFAPEQWLILAFGLVSLLLLIRFVASLLRVRKIIRSHTVQKIDDINFVDTTVDGTPFSFFNYIFWNRDISLQTATGQQIFQHEKVHVAEKHTVDKLLMQTVLVFFWCNPFFWLIRKELHFIHEFIADQKAVRSKGAADFAAMILQAAYPQQFSSITNPFFQKSIKRRIAMLTKKQKPGLMYIGRILALLVIATTVFAFTVRTETARELNSLINENDRLIPVFLSQGNTALFQDTVPQKKAIREVDVKKNPEKKVSEITITYTDGTREKMTGEEAEKRGLINNSGYGNMTRVQLRSSDIRIGDTAAQGQEPLYILDGKEISKAEMSRIDPNQIEAINVLKDKKATKIYGDKGKNGVIEITLKAGSNGKPVVRDGTMPNGQQENNGVTIKDVIVGNPPGDKGREITVDDNKIFEKTETPASVDKEEWRIFLSKNLQPIIVNAAKKGANPGTYTVKIRFLVKKDGSISDVTALNDPYQLGTKVVEFMTDSPKWKPAEQNGRVVNAYHTQPITFVIQEM